MSNLEPKIRANPFFHEMKPQYIAVEAKGATEQTFKAGGNLMHKTEPANRSIESGAVSVEAHEPGALTVEFEALAKGDVLGWSWPFPPYTWHLRARAMEPTTVIVINAAQLLAHAAESALQG